MTHRQGISVGLLCLVATLTQAQVGDAVDTPLLAARITPDNHHRAIRGPAAIAGLGDWMLSNGTLCASISDLPHETYLSHRGGTLVDLGFCGRGDDQWRGLHDMFNLSRDAILAATDISASTDGSSASIRIRGETQGVYSETHYRMYQDKPALLDMETRLTRQRDDARLFLLGTLILHPHRALTPFAVSTQDPRHNKGFHLPAADSQDNRAMLKAMFPTDLQVLVGPDHGQAPPISYGVQNLSAELIDTEGQRHNLRQFAINNDEITLLGSFSRPLWLDTEGQPGALQFAQTPFMDLKPGETVVITRRILVSPRADVAGVTDQLYAGAWIQGHTDNSANRILVTDHQQRPLTFVQPAADGRFGFRAPVTVEGLRLVLNEPHADASRERVLSDPTQTVALLSTQHHATLLVETDTPLQLVFIRTDGAPPPELRTDTRDFRVGDQRFERDIASNRVSLLGTEVGPTPLTLPAGSYRVYATRGPEYSLEQVALVLDAGERRTLSMPPPRPMVDTQGWIAADFHVHSEFSFDSTLPVAQRIADFVAQGGELVVSTEHNRIVDYAPVVKAMGLQSQLATITGVELSGMAHTAKIPRTIGHSNAFPVVESAQLFQGGTLPLEDRRLGEVIHSYKQQDALLQLNHPRAADTPDADIHFLDHLSIGRLYDPTLPLTDAQNRSLLETHPGSDFRDIDFDAMELLNGEDIASYARVRADWFSFLRQGFHKTGTANSDSHRSAQLVAMPRNYVRVKDDMPATLDHAALLDAIYRGDLAGSTGPLLDIQLADKRPGDTFTGDTGVLSILVRSADWIPVTELRVYVDGQLHHQQPIDGEGEYTLPLTIARAGFVTVEVQGPATPDYRAIYPGLYPFAFSNPIYLAPGVPAHGR